MSNERWAVKSNGDTDRWWSAPIGEWVSKGQRWRFIDRGSAYHVAGREGGRVVRLTRKAKQPKILVTVGGTVCGKWAVYINGNRVSGEWGLQVSAESAAQEWRRLLGVKL